MTDDGEYELRCLSPQDLYTLGHALEAVYAETDRNGELHWPGRDSRPEELWFLIAMVYGHEGGQRLRPPLTAVPGAVTDRTAGSEGDAS